MKNIPKEFYIVLAVCIFAGALLYNNYLNNKAKERMYFYQQVEKENKEKRLDACFKVAYDVYNENWESSCEDLGLGVDCKLTTSTAKRWDDMLEQEKKNCISANK